MMEPSWTISTLTEELFSPEVEPNATVEVRAPAALATAFMVTTAVSGTATVGNCGSGTPGIMRMSETLSQAWSASGMVTVGPPPLHTRRISFSPPSLAMLPSWTSTIWMRDLTSLTSVTSTICGSPL